MLPKLESKKLIERCCYYPTMWKVIRDNIGMPIKACEIGTKFGFWARGFLKYVGVEDKLYCVDNWPPHRNFTFYARAWQHTLGENAFTKAILLRGSSNEWAGVIDIDFDLIYVDGNHDYEYVRKDLMNWWPKLRVGGIMLLHDCDFATVAQAVDEFFSDKVEELTEERLGPKRVCLTRWCIKQE